MKWLLSVFTFCSFLLAPMLAQGDINQDERQQILELNDQIESFVSSQQYTDGISFCNAQLRQNLPQSIGRFITMQKMRLFVKSRQSLDSISYLYNKHFEIELPNDSTENFISARAIETMGFYYYLNNDKPSAIKFLKKADNIYQTINATTFQVYNLRNIGNIYYSQFNYTDALLTQFKAKQMLAAKKPLDTTLYVDIMIDVGLAYYNLNNYEKALENYLECTQYKLTPKHEAQILNNIGIIQIEQNDFENALMHLKSAKKLFTKQQDYVHLAKLYNNMANAMIALDHPYDTVVHYFNQSINLKKSIGDYEGLVSSYINISEYFFNNSKIELYEKNFQELLKLQNHWKTIDYSNYYLIQSRYFHFQKDYKKAFEYHQLHHKYADSIYKQTSQWKLTKAENEIEVQKKQTQIDLLEKEKVIASIKNKNQRTQIWAISIVSLTLVMVLIFVANYYYKRQLLEKKLRSREVQLASVSNLVTGQEEERKRLARELHDDIGSNLALIQAEVIKNNTKESNYLLDLVQSTSLKVREITHDLMPATVKKFGLKKALEEISQQWQHTNQILIDINFHPQEIEFSNTQSLTIFRIVQELIKNSVIHGKADYTLINFYKKDDEILFDYQDNGSGFSTSAENSDGIGMLNIKNRVAYLNGNMEIVSSEKGVKFSFTFKNQTK